MVLLENEAFLTALTRMFQSSRNASSVLITVKRYDGIDKPTPQKPKDVKEPEEHKCLIRATVRSKKISTVVSNLDLPKFYQSYSSLLKGNMDGLKKLKKPKSKAKATQ